MDGNQQTVSVDAITVTKRLDKDRFNTPAVVMEIRSTADRKTPVTVIEPIPDSFPVENIGFHPEFGSEHWAILNDRIVFNRTLDPDSEYTTLYGIREAGDEELRTFLDSETTVSTRNDVAVEQDNADNGGDDGSIEELLLEGDDRTVRDVITGKNDSLASPEAEEVGEPEVEEVAEPEAEEVAEPEAEEVAEPEAEEVAEPEAEEVAEPEAEEAVEPEKQEADEDADKSEAVALGTNTNGFNQNDFIALEAEEADEFETEDADVDSGEDTDDYKEPSDSVAEALAREIRDGSISEENERVLREAFSERSKTQRDVDLRIKQLQTQVADVAAYTDEFERFLDKYGTGDGVLNAFDGSLSDVISRVQELEDSLETVNQQVIKVESKLEAMHGELDDRADEIDSLEDRVTNAETGLEEEAMELNRHAETISDLEATVEALNAEMERMKQFRDRLGAFGPVVDQIEEQDDG